MCPHCLNPLAASLRSPLARCSPPDARQRDILLQTKSLIERHASIQHQLPRFIGSTAKLRNTLVRHRLQFLRPLLRHDVNVDAQSEDRRRAIHRLCAKLIDDRTLNGRDDAQRFDPQPWPAFWRRYTALERLYVQVLSTLNRVQRDHCAQSHGLLRLATRLFRLAWEGVRDLRYLDNHAHPAFGVALWLSVVELRYPSTTYTKDHMMRAFRRALQLTLAAALSWAMQMITSATRVHSSRLLMPDIVEATRSQIFYDRNPQRLELAISIF